MGVFIIHKIPLQLTVSFIKCFKAVYRAAFCFENTGLVLKGALKFSCRQKENHPEIHSEWFLLTRNILSKGGEIVYPLSEVGFIASL